MKNKSGIYCRVSTIGQQNGLDAQVKTMTEFVERQGITDFEIFSDHGISGAKESKPALDRLIKAANDEELSNLKVYSFSRFALSTTHLLRALESFQKLGVELIFIPNRSRQTR